MPNNISVENSFIGGLKTEFTGLNFPENACTSATNCVFSLIGDVRTREGIDFEQNFNRLVGLNPLGGALNTYRWRNAGGDGNSEVLVLQSGTHLYFFLSSASTVSTPLSKTKLFASLDLSNALPGGSTFANTWSQFECQFSDGNGILFVFHPYLNPAYVIYNPTTLTIIGALIDVKIRDFAGINPEPGNPLVTQRPTTLSSEHQYNLLNQGWTNNNMWTATAFTTQGANYNITVSGVNISATIQNSTFNVPTGLPITPPVQVNLNWSLPITYTASGDGNYSTTATGTAQGVVTSYSGGVLVVNVTSSSNFGLGTGASAIVFTGPVTWTIGASNLINTINTWFSQVGNFPSNSDIWWEFRDTTNTFNPATTISHIPLSNAQAPQGHFILDAFNQQRDVAAGIPGLTETSTFIRPRTGCWFQGRVWFAGVDDSFAAQGDAPYYTWTENIYFSQIVSTPQDFGNCYQANDPTDDRLFSLEPDDGGVIVIQGTGPIYKLFPIQNGLLVFAANGIWLIRGNSGLGFTANDFSVNKISAVQSISGTSFVDVLGLPFFWNQEGIYKVVPTQNQAPYGFGGLSVEPLTVGTILSFYNNIPTDSKRFARGAYDPISYVLNWVYRSTQETTFNSRYQFDSILNLNILTKAFYPYTLGNNGINFISGINYISYPNSANGLTPTVKYLVTDTSNNLTFAEERDSTNWGSDWVSSGLAGKYTASFTTGYKLHGQGFRKFMPIYVNMFSSNQVPTAYNIQGIWDYATSTSTGKITSKQLINNPITSRTMASGIHWPDTSDFGTVFRRHKIPGHGNVLQLQVSSVPGKPFDIIGWSIPEQINVGA